MTEMELIKKFIQENSKGEFFMPEDFIILSKVSNSPEYLRRYFEWKGKNGL